jgi:hypothetical protein
VKGKGNPTVFSHAFKTRGHSFRMQTDDRGRFDEIAVVVGQEPKPKERGGLILHAEMMGSRSAFIDVCGIGLWCCVGSDGVARIAHAEDRRAGGRDMPELRDPALDTPKKKRTCK